MKCIVDDESSSRGRWRVHCRRRSLVCEVGPRARIRWIRVPAGSLAACFSRWLGSRLSVRAASPRSIGRYLRSRARRVQVPGVTPPR